MTENRMLTKEELELVLEAVLKGTSLAKATGIAQETLEGLYAVARDLYVSGNFTDAQTVFQALSLYDADDWRFWMGLAGCRQALENFSGAVDAYQMASIATNLKNPEPLFYAVKCLLKMNRKEDAVAGLQGLLELSDKTDPAYAATLEKARALLDLLRSGGAQ